ncbi:MAG: ABC transporter ATP-binding protein [Rickettsiales bacterium]
MNNSPLLLDSVSKNYSGINVLDNASLSLSAGEIFGLIGLNGAGKTTMIKIILDLINKQDGSIQIFGNVKNNIESRSNISYLPEKFQPSRYLKGTEYLELSLAYYGKKLDKDKARKKAITLDLNPDVLDSKVGSYSKGMGQKLGLVGAFLTDASFLILDEPMSGLDPRARIRLKNELISNKKLGKTIFFSSHILSDIDEICDRIAILHEGSLHFIGTPAEFKQKTACDSLEQAFLKTIE